MNFWPFIPQREFGETLEWLTDLIVCKGAEQRIALRPLPRQSYSYQLLMTENQFNRAKSLLFAKSQEEFQIPLWNEFTKIGGLAQGSTEVAFDTRYAQYQVGGDVVILDEDDRYEVVTIQSLTDSLMTFSLPTTKLYSDAVIAPVQVVRLAQAAEFTRGANNYIKAAVEFAGTDTFDISASSYPTYLSHPVLTDRAVLISDIRERIIREVVTTDNGVGPIVAQAKSNWVSFDSQMGWSTLTREELWALRRWLYYCQGKQRGFWLPTWGHDFEPVSPILSTDTTIMVQSVGYADHYGVRDIMVRTVAGVNHYKRVLSASPGLGSTEVLDLGSAFGTTLALNQIESISLMNFMRFDSDRIEIRHKAARGAAVLVPVKEIPNV